MEENSGYNVAYEDLAVWVVAYDVDLADYPNVAVQQGTRGETTVLIKEQDAVSVIAQDCSLSWQQRSNMWEELEQDMIIGQPQITLPFPCNLDNRVFEVSSTTWSTLLIQYKPDEGFYGVDEVKVRITLRIHLVNLVPRCKQSLCAIMVW